MTHSGVMEVIASPNPQPSPIQPLGPLTGSQRGSAVSTDSAPGDAVILSPADALKPPPIDNSALCVQESTVNKKLPSLTNEGKSLC